MPEDDVISFCSEVVAEFSDLGSADFTAALLITQGVRAKIDPGGLLAGLHASYRVLVDLRQLHRARWILQDPDLSDGELTYLATGELNPPEE